MHLLDSLHIVSIGNSYMLTTLKNLWFRDTKESNVHINDVAVRIRAGILLIIPLYM